MSVVSSINTADRHDITEILLKVALNTINLNLKMQKNNKSTVPVLSLSCSFTCPFLLTCTMYFVLFSEPGLVVFNIVYVILFGWWQALLYLLLGIIMYLTIVGRQYGMLNVIL